MRLRWSGATLFFQNCNVCGAPIMYTIYGLLLLWQKSLSSQHRFSGGKNNNCWKIISGYNHSFPGKNHSRVYSRSMSNPMIEMQGEYRAPKIISVEEYTIEFVRRVPCID